MPACLVSVKNGATFVLDKAIILIGRQAECDLVLPDSRKISRLHCCVAQVDDSYLIRDLASLNGVRVNGNRVRESQIQEGDEIAIGDIHFKFEFREKIVVPRKDAAPAGAKQSPNPAQSRDSRKQSPENLPDLELDLPGRGSSDRRKGSTDPLSRDTPKRPPPVRKGKEDDGILELDSGEIELSSFGDS